MRQDIRVELSCSSRDLDDHDPALHRVPFKEKFLYTSVTLFIFLVCSQLPLYGIKVGRLPQARPQAILPDC